MSDNLMRSSGLHHSLSVLIVFLLAGPASGLDPFKDPAKPVVLGILERPAPAPQPHPRGVFHSPPKPLAEGAATNDWVSFLGPTHDGHSIESPLLKEFPETGPNLVWEMKTGSSYSSPAIRGERLVYFHRIGEEDTVECLNPETGQFYWRFSYPTQYQDRYGYNNGPRASPVIDGEWVYVYAANGMLHCLHLETGQVRWKRHLSREFRVPQDFFGVSCTPLIQEDLLIFNLGAPKGPCVIALNKETGELAWGAGDKWGPSYASPVPARIHDQQRVFVFAGGDSDPPTGGLLCLDPATGAIDFEFPWRSKSYESVNASCPVVWGNKVFISASYETGGAMLEVLSDFTRQLRWTADGFATHFNTSIYRDGYLYGFDGRHPHTASLVCFEAETGNEMWRETPEWEITIQRRGKETKVRRGTLRGTLIHADGAFLCLGESGALLWLDLSPMGYKEVARATLFDAPETWCPPVVSRGLLYICQNTKDIDSGTPPRLLCYDLRGSR